MKTVDLTKQQEIVDLLDSLVAAGNTHTVKSAEFRAISWKLRHRGLSKEQTYGLVHSFRASHYRAHQDKAALAAMSAEGLEVRDFLEFHAELVAYLVLPISQRSGHRAAQRDAA
ncbi:hypothetical protein B0G84_3246 [Paraburkholderia sp. BL8N3]|nr:hypothetical protein [Paraburkholderia sp. BL8N3]TCK37948.1 hypothetical protein B0G84_3246 [Paraburkholderia sp. BL8N3]